MRIAIINKDIKKLYIEDIIPNVLERDYNNDIEAYIKDNYFFEDVPNYSWSVIEEASFLSDNPSQDAEDLWEIIDNL